MDLEKKNENNKWYKSDNIRLRLINDGDKSIVAVNLDGYNILLKLMMFDFARRIKEGLLLDVGVVKIWNGQRVFTIDSSNSMEFIDYIPVFVAEWNIKIDENTISDEDAISDEIWYGDNFRDSLAPASERRTMLK